MRCDLHVHSYYSGFVNQPVLRHLGRDSYSDPRNVYDTAKRRGMDLVTLSDHDSIEGALQLAGRDDFFVSEEVTCVMEENAGWHPRVLHLGVLGITEAQHEAIALRRTDPARLVAYLDEERLAWCVNHLFSPLTGPRTMSDFSFVLERAHALETKNSMMPSHTNDFAARVAGSRGLGTVGGSDAHAVGSVARAYTEVAGATSVPEFLEGVRSGRAVAMGHSGNTALLTRDVAVNFALGYIESFRNAYRSGNHALRALALVGISPIIPFIPMLTSLIFRKEIRGSERLYAEFIGAGLGELESSPEPVDVSIAEPAL